MNVMDYKEYIAERLEKATGLSTAELIKVMEIPPDPKLGDIAFTCFILARVMRKAPPVIAGELKALFDNDDIFERVEAVGGYLNFFCSRAAFITDVMRHVKESDGSFAKSDIGKGKTVLVEYSSPNIAKPYHIGHLF